MKLPVAMMALFATGAVLFAEQKPSAAPAILPSKAPAGRYAPMMGKGPFSPATPPPADETAAAEQTPSFAQNLYVIGISNLGGKDYVYIMARDQQRGFSLMEGETTPDGISLVHIDKSPEIGKSKVTLKKNTEFGTITFDEAAISTPPVAQQAPQPPRVPGFVPPPMNRRFNAPGTIPSRRRIVLPQNPGVSPYNRNVPGFSPGQVIRRPRTIMSRPVK